jgi:hypothetical protein
MRNLLTIAAAVVITGGASLALGWLGVIPQDTARTGSVVAIGVTLIVWSMFVKTRSPTGAETVRSRPAHVAAVVGNVCLIALVFFFGMVWFGIAALDEARWFALLFAISLAVILGLHFGQMLVEALVNRLRGGRG